MAVVADALVSKKIALAMGTPGMHSHFAYGGIPRFPQPAIGLRAREYLSWNEIIAEALTADHTREKQ